ncbi:PEP-CTERM sorting domain-containing protein [Nitrosospira lacus]|nr:PEP-CTERM sorting domain-containing protein [Nitrosospira lacus]
MNILSKSVIAALALAGMVSTATASGVITSVTASGPGLESFSVLSNSTNPNTLGFSNVFSGAGPITLTFTVAHGTGNGGAYDVTGLITNNTTLPFTDFHLSITEPADVKGNGVVFTSFKSSMLGNFLLASPSVAQPDPFHPTGPRDLNFTEGLAAGEAINAGFNLKMFDPGAGNTYTFTLTQTPTVSVVPEPETYAMLLAGLGLIGFIATHRRGKTKHLT